MDGRLINIKEARMLEPSDLLPYSNNNLLSDLAEKLDVLTKLVFITDMFVQAIDAFMQGRLSEFDAHVGDCLCQIRAYQILLMFRYRSDYDLLIEKDKLKKLSCLLHDQVDLYTKHRTIKRQLCPKEMTKKETLQEFLTKQKIHFNISRKSLIVLQCFFLSKYKEMHSGYTILDHNAIQKGMQVSRDFSRRMLQLYQKKVAEASCDFISDLLAEAPSLKGLRSAIHLFKENDEQDRLVYPSFLVGKIILEDMLYRQNPILIKSNKRKVVLYPCARENSYFENSPCFILDGLSMLDKGFYESINKFGIENIILSNMAIHPQYPGEKLSHLKNNPFRGVIDSLSCEQDRQDEYNALKKIEEEFITMKYIALEQGCHIGDHSLFISSIYIVI